MTISTTSGRSRVAEGDAIPKKQAPRHTEIGGPWSPTEIDGFLVKIGELFLSTRPPTRDPDERKALFALYTRELSKLPHGRVMARLKAYRGVFFPALDEIRAPIEADIAEEATRARRRAAAPPPPPPRPPDEVRDRMSSGFKSLVAELRTGGLPK